MSPDSRLETNALLRCLDYGVLCGVLAIRRTVTLANMELSKVAVAVPVAVYEEWRERFGTDGTTTAGPLEPCTTCEVHS